MKIEEQEVVVNSRGKNIIVSASAGSGKTTVMIRRISEMLENKQTNVENLLVLTYTKASAVEMKQRLVQRLSQKVEEFPFLREQVEDINTADISTFDSFCQKLVKKYFYADDIDPGFSVLAGSEESLLKQKCLTSALSEYEKTSPESFAMLYDFYAANRTDKSLREIIKKIFDFSTSILDYEQWKNEAKQQLLLADKSVFSNYLFEDIKQRINLAKTRLQQTQMFCQQNGLLEYVEYINVLLSQIDGVVLAKNLNDAIVALSDLSLSALPRKNFPNDIFDIKEKLKKHKQIVSKLQETYENMGGDKHQFSHQQVVETSQSLLEIVDLFKKHYAGAKKRKNVMDYNDIERCVITILEKNQQIRQSIQNKYEYIFVDEFQDANRIQEKIINLLRRENNVFFVGDLKQAIYGFRQSNSEIFEQIEQQFLQESQSQALSLKSNFRSNPKILDFINNIFCTLMTPQTAHLDYAEKAKLEGKADYKPNGDCVVKLAVIYKPKQKEEKSSQALPMYDLMKHNEQDIEVQSAEMEARFIAEEITKVMMTQIYDAKTKVFRPTKYSDITILLRKRGAYQDKLIQTLTALGVPVVQNINTKLDDTLDARVLCDLIAISLNHKDDTRLASVMMSELFDFSADEMATIRSENCGEFFYECVQECAKGSSELSAKIAKMFNYLAQFEKDCKFLGLGAALEKIVQKTNYILKISNSEFSLERTANTLNFISSFSGTAFEFNAAEFVNFVEKEKREDKVCFEAKQKDVVQITTMHSSKGLEYPIVFVANLGDNFNRSPEHTEVKLSEKWGMGVKFFESVSRNKLDSAPFLAIKMQQQKQELSELLRLLYVALTRAKNKLVLVGTTQKLDFEKILSEYDVFSKSTYLSQIVGCLTENDIQKINSQTQGNLFDDKDFCLEIVEKKGEQSENLVPQKALFVDGFDEEKQKLAEYISKTYKNKEATTLAKKNSVSALASQDDFSSQNYAPEKLTLNEHTPVAQKPDIGTLYHKILENCEFDYGYEQIKNVAKKLSLENSSQQDLISALDIKLIYNNIQTLKTLCEGRSVFKEQKFMMRVPYSSLQKSEICDNVLVQGVCDLIAIKDNDIILVDYKYSSSSEQTLKQRYEKQLALYKTALSLYKENANIKCYILSIKQNKLIEM
ncbi:MAG: UvrD-helicase domain-containing protein [Clostridia bacterium]|nr:UvrD-helicase domain-containing protein [Clostridia bacterium]